MSEVRFKAWNMKVKIESVTRSSEAGVTLSAENDKTSIGFITLKP